MLVRIIPDVEADTHASVLTGHEGSKFGLAPDAAAELIGRIERSPRLRMRGLHVHVGSQILDVEPFAQSVAPLAALGEFEVYDLGGGLGVRYTYDDVRRRSPTYLDALVGAAREQLPADAELIVEPGRSMVAAAAATIYRVVTVKRGAVTFVAVDGGMGDNLEVALFGQRFEAAIADRLDARGRRAVTLVGRHCESGDVLVDGVRLDAPRVGDLVAVPVTGRLLPHDGEQLQRQPQDPGGLRARRRGPARGAPRDVGRPARARRRVRRSDGITARADPAAQAGHGDGGGDRRGHEGGELKRSITLFQLSLFGIGATIGTGIFIVLLVGGAGGRARGGLLVRLRRRRRRAHGDLLRRAGERGAGLRLVVLVRLRDARRGDRDGRRGVPAAGVRRLRRGGRRRLVAVPQRGARQPVRLHDPRRPLERARAGRRLQPAGGAPDPLCASLLIRGASESAKVNAIMVLIKVGVLVLFIVIGATGWDSDNLSDFTPFGVDGIEAAAGIIFFSYIGLDAVSTAGEEVHNPRRNLPLAIIIALVTVTTLYVLVAIVAVAAQPVERVRGPRGGPVGDPRERGRLVVAGDRDRDSAR